MLYQTSFLSADSIIWNMQFHVFKKLISWNNFLAGWISEYMNRSFVGLFKWYRQIHKLDFFLTMRWEFFLTVPKSFQFFVAKSFFTCLAEVIQVKGFVFSLYIFPLYLIFELIQNFINSNDSNELKDWIIMARKFRLL